MSARTKARDVLDLNAGCSEVAARARVRRFYDRTAASEACRLDENVYRRLERDMTMRTLARHVAAGARILDVGGGPGAYLGPLVRAGYDPWLCDLSPVEVARAAKVARGLGLDGERAEVCDATALLGYKKGSFDAALVAGPFYHLTDATSQRRV
jgi:SAM-dependent methyltransferase